MKIDSQLFVGMLCGGLGGAIFSYLVNRPDPAIITYSVTTTKLEANEATKGLIPDLKIQVGKEVVPVIITHTIVFAAQKGAFLGHSDVAIEFRTPVRFFGRVLTEGPSALHKIDCKREDKNVLCSIGPLVPGQGSFRVVVVTDQGSPPHVAMVAENAKLVQAEVFLAGADRIFGVHIGGVGLFAMVITGLIGSVTASWYVIKRFDGKGSSTG